MKNTMMNRARAALQDAVGYTVVVVWEEKIIMHHSWTRGDAIAWVAAYPYTARVCVFKGLRARMVARRMGV
jgi:hypothetical protein